MYVEAQLCYSWQWLAGTSQEPNSDESFQERSHSEGECGWRALGKWGQACDGGRFIQT